MKNKEEQRPDDRGGNMEAAHCLFHPLCWIGNLFQQLSIIQWILWWWGSLSQRGPGGCRVQQLADQPDYRNVMGISVGAGVIISQYYGAKSAEKMSWAVHTSMALSLVGGGADCRRSGVFPVILRWMKTPEEVLANPICISEIHGLGPPSIWSTIWEREF